MVKGSAAAKAYMKKLRGMQGGGKKKKATKPTGTGSTSTGGGRRMTKLPSASKGAILLGGGMIVTGLGLDQVAAVMDRANTMLDEIGISVAVTGGSVITVLVVAKIISSFNNWFGRKWRAFLRGYGLRP